MNLSSISYFENVERDLIIYLLENNKLNITELSMLLNKAVENKVGFYGVVEENLLIDFITEEEDSFINMIESNNDYLVELVRTTCISNGDTIKELLGGIAVLDNFIYFMNNYKIYKICEEFYLVYLDN